MKKTITFVVASISIIVIVGVLRNCPYPMEKVRRVPTGKIPDITKVSDREISAGHKKQQEIYEATAEEQRVIDGTEALLYGKVVDQNNEPVPAAEVVCLPNHDPWVSGQRRTVIKADENGRFLIRERNAPSIHVSVSAKGYYTTQQSRDSFGFAELPNSAPKNLSLQWKGTTHSSQDNPKIFTLRKMGTREPLLHRTYAAVIKEQKFYLIGLEPSQSILVKYFLDPNPKRIHENGWEIYNWGIQISMQSGGLIKAEAPQNELPNSFIAPLSGYQPAIRFNFDDSMDDSTFQRDLNSQFFAKFADGTYARFRVNFEMDPKRPFGSVESWFNPSGGRATEFDPSIQIETSP